MHFSQSETFVERKARYVLDLNDWLFIVENALARMPALTRNENSESN